MAGVELGGKIRKLYFIGIGGVHMSGLAELLMLSGYAVGGSDTNDSAACRRLRGLGADVSIGHNAAHIDRSIDIVVYTSAVKADNPEIRRARELSLTVMDRAKLLGLVMESYKYPVCIAGAHGKTTTTTMVAEILMKSGRNPTIMNGGICPSINASMKAGGFRYFVAEADEYYDAFLKLRPYVGVILNIDKDHTDYFATYDKLWQSFRRFTELTHEDGALVVNAGVPEVERLTAELPCRVVTFGNQTAAWQARNVSYGKDGKTSFDAVSGGKTMGQVTLGVPGSHNVDNALAAIAACSYLGLEFGEIAIGLEGFTGSVRRFQRKGFFKGAAVIDDFAHHPTEVRATLEAAKNIKEGRVWCVFQPHTRSRTIEFLDPFAMSLSLADKVLLVDIYTPSGREEDHINVSSADVAAKLSALGGDASVCRSFSEAAAILEKNCRPGDMIITMGAGDVYKIGDSLVQNGNV